MDGDNMWNMPFGAMSCDCCQFNAVWHPIMWSVMMIHVVWLGLPTCTVLLLVYSVINKWIWCTHICASIPIYMYMYMYLRYLMGTYGFAYANMYVLIKLRKYIHIHIYTYTGIQAHICILQAQHCSDKYMLPKSCRLKRISRGDKQGMKMRGVASKSRSHDCLIATLIKR